MVDRGVGFEPAQDRHPHAVRLADAREIVAQQIDDHDVLGPLLGVGLEGFAEARIGLRVGDPADRPLDRPGLDRPSVQLQEALGAAGGDVQALEGEIGPEGRRVGGAQAPVEGERIEARRQRRLEALGDVGLIDVAGPDVVAHPLHRRLVGGAGEVRAPGQRPLRRRFGAGTRLRQQGGELRQPLPGPGLAGGGLRLGKARGEEAAAAGAVIDAQHRVVEVDDDIVAEARPPSRGRHPFQAGPEVIGEVADRAAREGREVRFPRDPVGGEAGAQGVEARPRQGPAVEGGDAVPEPEAPERVRRQGRGPAEGVVGHGAVEEGEARQGGQGLGRRDGIHGGKLSNPHDDSVRRGDSGFGDAADGWPIHRRYHGVVACATAWQKRDPRMAWTRPARLGGRIPL